MGIFQKYEILDAINMPGRSLRMMIFDEKLQKITIFCDFFIKKSSPQASDWHIYASIS